MKQFMLLMMTMMFFIKCQKQDLIGNVSDGKSDKISDTESIDAKGSCNPTKISICHYDHKTRKSKTIMVSPNALSAHLAHGDVQGDCLATVTTICNQDWRTKNLDVTSYRNGDAIPQVADPSAWANLTTGAWCFYENNSSYGPAYGKLYNWFAVNDPRGLAPEGWHIPSDIEWNILLNCLGGYEVAGGALKEVGTTHWFSPNTGATNSSGFTGLPGGIRADEGLPFVNIGYEGNWWSSSESTAANAIFRSLLYSAAIFGRNTAPKGAAMSVRCIRN